MTAAPYVEYRTTGGTMRVVVNVDTCAAIQEHGFGGASAYGGQRRLGFYPPMYVHFDGSVSSESTPPRCGDQPTVAFVKQPETGDLLEVSNLSEALHACYPRPAKWQDRFASPEALASHRAWLYRQARAAVSSRQSQARAWSPGVLWCGESDCKHSCNHKRASYIDPPTGESV